MKRILLFTLGLLLLVIAKAQEVISITQGTATACTGALLDSGGEGASGYGNNENYTLTICPDSPDGAISLQWITFNLSTEGNPPLDQLSIYDGSSSSAPLIGTWNGSNSPGIVGASFANTEGCLTLIFTSNNIGTGVFGAAVTCYQPCEPPTAVASVVGETIPVLGCQDQLFSFDASASYAVSGFNIEQYIWHFDDGSVDSTSGPTVTHSYTEPGEYVVQVDVIDDNECANTNLVDLQILVSTTPLFNGLTQSQTICQGDSLLLDGTGTIPVNWSAVPSSNIGSPIALPDSLGVPFITSIVFDSFDPGQVLESCDDILSICANMEHSFMGDLVINITCPNGQTQTLHQQGGGGTFLGDANDMDFGSNVAIGQCWNYCWSSTATLGTWADESGNNNMPTSQGSALIPDTYSPVGSCTQLIGCPLNGEWTFTITDMWGADNGFLCDWELNFDPALFPSLTTFTPDLGLEDADSAYWSGPDIVDAGPAVGTLVANTPGEHEFTFTVMDNFGCSYDTTITITVLPNPGGPIVITGTDSICTGGIAYLGAPGGYSNYVWSNGYTGQFINVGPGTYTVTVGTGFCPLTSDPFTVYTRPDPVPVIVGIGAACGGDPDLLSTEQPYDSYVWSNGSTESSISVGTGSYTVTVTENGCSGTSAPFQVITGSDPNAFFTTDPNSPQGQGTEVQFTDGSTGNGAAITDWYWSFGVVGQESTDQNPSYMFTMPGNYNVMLVVTASDGCQDTMMVSYVITPEDIIIPNVFTPNNDGQNDLFVIQNVQFYGNELAIFNRWGMKVFEETNYRNTWRATDIPEGTYYYTLRLNNGNDYHGHVTILR